MQPYAIIVAGGVGSRMNSALPKQFIEIQGQPVIIKTIRCFLKYDANMRIIISVHSDYKTLMEDMIKRFNLSEASITIITGGATRFDSVKNGLALVTDDEAVVGIHDAARPFVSQTTIKNCYETAALKGNAIPCVAVNESLRQVDNGLSIAVNRDAYRVVQTPQCFIASNIKKAFEQGYKPEFTDDATVLESTGATIVLVEGNVENIKITSPHDLLIANSLITI